METERQTEIQRGRDKQKELERSTDNAQITTPCTERSHAMISVRFGV